jgi:hypothetical protein
MEQEAMLEQEKEERGGAWDEDLHVGEVVAGSTSKLAVKGSGGGGGLGIEEKKGLQAKVEDLTQQLDKAIVASNMHIKELKRRLSLYVTPDE